jgi:predicted 2-oxoglutarate/Fe(II)-dependent dioxygenase YbiX
MELATGIVQYEFSDIAAKNIVSQAQSLDIWNKSYVMNIDGEQHVRTSYEASLEGNFDSLLTRFVQDSISIAIHDYSKNYIHCRINQNESVGILKYTPGGWYDTHIDASWQTYRILSMLIYLNPQDYEGGETWFPKFDIKIKPESPAIVLFPSNYVYEHQAMPVTDGEKFVLVSWMSDLPQHFNSQTLNNLQKSLNINHNDFSGH